MRRRASVIPEALFRDASIRRKLMTRFPSRVLSLSKRCTALMFAACLCATSSLAGAPATRALSASAPPPEDYAELERMLDERLFDDLARFVAIETYRSESVPESQVVANLEKLRGDLMKQAEAFNKGQKVHKLVPFEWKQKNPNGAGEYWLFGLRLGSGPRRISLSSHLDTVPPGDNPHWEPFVLKKEKRRYLGDLTEFYVGRGAIDDKGPALVAFNVLKALARRYDSSPKLERITIELLFDTSEETDMAMPHYLKANPQQKPDLGVIYDASWCIRAEKGLERPVFSIKKGAPKQLKGLWIESLNTPQGPVNQIPDKATAVIRADSKKRLEAFAQVVDALYQRYPFDDPRYRRANLTVELQENQLVLTTDVEGAQHGSAPDENRENGANPLVSLANFLGGLVEEGKLARNEVGELSRFIAWAWGTQVFGEHHPELLQRHDEVFTEKNGTTYALTRFYTHPQGSPEVAANLQIDIRYALGHHAVAWDKKTEGLVGGEGSKSTFQGVFGQLLNRYKKDNAAMKFEVQVSTETLSPPDVRLPQGESFQRVSSAYQRVMGVTCPARAIGGGTDAKGDTHLIAAGALFSDSMGPPINFHGFNEGAPVDDLKRGALVLYRLFADEIEAAGNPVKQPKKPVSKTVP